ncbi:IS5 family transposase [uncultured Ruegeria sp.]|uniref:IS5 family transposase n=1 Tax=uncultured Ruegeria sp. TaxID=259304 RepID=UPI002609CDA7|nr:IS5 family transposase [uncultured Ruegeria sp.]
MPYKFNDARRDKFDKARYRVTNWSEYSESLRKRGELTIWVSDNVARNWASPRRTTRGGQAVYSDLAIEICLTMRVVFRLALRQTQGFMRSIAKLMGLDLVVPDFSTLSRRSKRLKITQHRCALDKQITLIVDSTGLKMHDGNGWHEEKHGAKRARKTCRKLNIALDPGTGKINASKLTSEHVGDETTLPELLAQVDVIVERFLADGAYNGKGVYGWLLSRFGPDIEVVVPPPKNAVLGENRQRNQHIENIAEHGGMTWQADTGYNQRSRVEAQIRRWNQVIGSSLQAQATENQIFEISIATKVLNRMTELGYVNYERVS